MERTNPRQPWGAAENFTQAAVEQAQEPTPEPAPEPAPPSLEDTPIFGELQARWLSRDRGRPGG